MVTNHFLKFEWRIKTHPFSVLLHGYHLYIVFMEKRFSDFIIQHQLIEGGGRAILAVSGGIDSMVMAHLFHVSGIPFAIAHCNFRLRAKEAGGDEAFVEQYAADLGVPFFKRRFNTRSWAKRNGFSVQMAARDLRYRWFNQLMRLENYQYVATAHHADDDIETFFINLLRGTGIAGLQGIAIKNRAFIRPLLFANREEITQYAIQHRIAWREDSSNNESKYLRNMLRNRIIPLLADTAPSFKTTMYENMQRIQQAGQIYRKEVENQRRHCMMNLSNSTVISIPRLLELQPSLTYLFEFLQPYGFSYEKTCDIFRALDAQAGKQFYSPTHKLLKDRELLLIERRSGRVTKTKEWLIHEPDTLLKKPVKMQFAISDKKHFRFEGNESIAWLDYDKLRFPLILRRWKPGDFFYPLGMKNRKKLSDFFTDLKINRNEKQDIWILCSGADIVWIAGKRIDERFKVEPGSRKLLRIELKKEENGTD